MQFKKFGKDKRGGFSYWFWHVLAFNYTAIKHHTWRPKYLLHDFEKPWLMLWFGGDYAKVQKWHREHNRHHLEYKGRKEKDWEAMCVDWQCSHLTKTDKSLNARQEADRKLHSSEMKLCEYLPFIEAAERIGLSINTF